MGVPQSSILSPEINNAVKVLLKGWDCALFVDDFASCVRGKSLNRVERAVQLCVNSFQNRTSETGFKFSTSKTVCIHFYQRYGVFFRSRSLWKQILWVVWLSPERKDECNRQRIRQSSKNRKRRQQISGVEQSGLFRSRQFCSTTQWPLARTTGRKWTTLGFSGPSQFSQE